MFDIGFFEILVIAVVALLVVGPERLPKLARDVGRFVGKTRRFVQSVRADVERELATDELREMMREQNREIERLKRLMHETEDSMNRHVEDADRSIRRGFDDQRRRLETLDDAMRVGDFGQDDPRIPGIRREPVKFSDDGSLMPVRDEPVSSSGSNTQGADAQASDQARIAGSGFGSSAARSPREGAAQTAASPPSRPVAASGDADEAGSDVRRNASRESD